PSLAVNVPDPAGLTIGQGYNTFLGRGMVRDAIMIKSNGEAASTIVDRSERSGDKNSTGTFRFTEPGPVMPGVSLNEYFTATTPEELAKIIEEAEKASSDKEKRDDASKIVLDEKPTKEGCPGEIQMKVDFVSDYKSYMKALGVNAAAAISGYGQSASVSGGYLDASAFSSNTLTFIATASIKKQRQFLNEKFTFNSQQYNNTEELFSTVFGNRWIRGFEVGGKLITRITLTFDESSDKKEIKAIAEASLQGYGVSSKLSAETKKNLEKLNKKAKVSVNTFYQGDIGRQLQGGSESSNTTNSAQQIFETAQLWLDSFLKKACNQDYRYGALLDRYTTIGNFPQEQSVPHYTAAGAIAYVILEEMVKHTELRRTLQKQEVLSRAEDRQIQQDEIQLIDAQKH
ncbi:hypothetical protein NHJ6243_010217, partial [Beauveria neobassiana]